MTKRIILFFLLFCKIAYAQDLIVTKNGDSINCKILERKGPILIFETTSGKLKTKKGVNTNAILKTEKNYYFITNDIDKESNFVLNFGYNKSVLTKYYRETNIDIYDKYFSKLTNGRTVHLDMTYWVFKRVGARLSYDNYYSTSSEDTMPMYNNNGVLVNYFLQEDLNIHSLSPGICYRTPIFSHKNNLILSASYEYNMFFNPYSINDFNAEMQAKSSGVNFGASLERTINNHFNIGFNVKYRFSKIENIDFVYDGNFVNYIYDEEDKLNLNRYDVGIIIGIK